MANITTKTTGALSAAAFAGAADTGFADAKPKSSSGGTPYLKIDHETGVWTYGQEDTTPPDDAIWAVQPATFAAGFAAWKGKSLEAKRMALIGQPPVDVSTLGPVVAQNGWQDSVAVVLILIESKSRPELEGTAVLFETVSRGGVEAWNKLFDATIARARAGNEDFAAVLKLSTTSYEHKTWGTVFKPVFSISEWETPAALIADFGEPPVLQLEATANEAAAEAPAVKAEGRRNRAPAAEAPVEDAEVVSEQPSRRRRRAE